MQWGKDLPCPKFAQVALVDDVKIQNRDTQFLNNNILEELEMLRN